MSLETNIYHSRYASGCPLSAWSGRPLDHLSAPSDAPDIYPPPLETNDISAQRTTALSLPPTLDFGIDFIGCPAGRSALQAHNTGVWTTLALDLLAAVPLNGVSEHVSGCGLTARARHSVRARLPGNRTITGCQPLHRHWGRDTASRLIHDPSILTTRACLLGLLSVKH